MDARDPDPLMDELRALVAKHDPVPPPVVETAKASLGWRRLDADLAELLTDSSLEEQTYALARGRGQVGIRSVSFSNGRVTIDVQIRGDEGERTVRGQITPSTGATVQIQQLDGASHPLETHADEFGRFRARVLGVGTIRFRVSLRKSDSGIGPDWIETSWIPL
jgi:hypothetical protein